MKNTKENLLTLLKAMRDHKYYLAQAAKSVHYEENFTTEAFLIEKIMYLLEDEKFFQDMWNIYMETKYE